MQPYQKNYIDNCCAIRSMLASSTTDAATLTRARGLMQENTRLLSDYLFPTLDNLYNLPPEELEELEQFGDEMNVRSALIDAPLSAQIFDALVNVSRQQKDSNALIRRLYKLGMARYNFFMTLNGIGVEKTEDISLRMRYCFSEAAGYLRFFADFPPETQGYIIRSQANIYLGLFHDWRTKLACVRRSMQIITDPYYRKLAPSLPWDRFEAVTHQQMSNVIPYSAKAGEVEPDMVVDVMESVHLVYEEQFRKLRESGQPVQPRWLMPYYALEYACGISTRETLLSRIEAIIDAADESSYDSASLYGMLSAPAFYMQFLQSMPEQLRERRLYIAQLYKRILRYMENMPDECMSGAGSEHSLRVLETFIEVPGGISMLHFSLYLLRRIAPEMFAHSIVSGRMSQRIAETILAGDPDYFSDVPELHDDPSGAPRLAFLAGAAHDTGMVVFRSLSGNNERQMLHAEFELRKLHTVLGKSQLSTCPSTQNLADTAYGHHRWYDGSDGFPEDYDRLKSPYRAITDIVALADYLDSNSAEDTLEPLRDTPFKTKCADAIALGGRRFSPIVTAWLRDKKLRKELRDLYENGYRRALEMTVPTREDSPAFLDALYRGGVKKTDHSAERSVD